MGKKSKIIGEAGGKVARKVGDKLNFNDFTGAAAKGVKDATEKVRRVSKRLKYLGRTPGKGSRTGREVIQRMRDEGKVVTKKVDGQEVEGIVWKDPRNPNAPEQFVPLKDCDMGHHPTDAVTYWNTQGYQHGPKSPEVREWMLDPNNYELQPYWYNRSAGASLGQTYRDI